MRNSIFNYDDGNFIYPTSDNMGLIQRGIFICVWVTICL